MDLNEIYGLLKPDREFFSGYKEKFVQDFTLNLKGANPMINTLVSKLYLLMFSFSKDPLKELFSLSYATAKSKFKLSKPLLRASMGLIRSYIDFLAKSENPIPKSKALIELVDKYIQVVEDAYVKYVSELEDELEQSRQPESEGRKAAYELLRTLFKDKKREFITKSKFKGLWVDSKSELVDMVEERLRVKTSHGGIYTAGDTVLLVSPFVPKPLEARVLEAQGELIELEILGFSKIMKERRKHIRVVPQEDISVKVLSDRSLFEGKIADISIRGLGILLEDASGLIKGRQVRANFRLPTGELELTAEVIYTLNYPKLHRVGLELFTDMKTEDLLSDYVVKRQLEILRLMRDAGL